MKHAARFAGNHGVLLVLLLCCGACRPVTTVPGTPGRLYVDADWNRARPPRFDTIQGALDYAARGLDGATSYTITVAPGVYRENLSLRTPGVTLEGESRDRVVVRPPVHLANPQILIDAGDVTLRGLTIDGRYEDPDKVKYNMYVRLAGDRDDVLVEDCRFRRTRVGVLVLAAVDPAEFNENIVFRGNRFESSQTAIRVDATGLEENQGKIDFTSRDNQMVMRSIDEDENILAVLIRRLHLESRFRSIDDTFDLEGSHTQGRGDVQAFMFHDWIPALSEIVAPRIRVAHNGRTSPHQNLFAVKIHSTLLRLPDRPHVVSCADMQVHLVDRTRQRVGGTANLAYSGADKVVVLVSGGTVTHDLDPAGGMEMRTFTVDPAVRAPYGIFYAGLPVETVHHIDRSGALIEPLRRRRAESPRNLTRRTQTEAPEVVVFDGSGEGSRLCLDIGGQTYCTPEMPCADCGN